VTFLSLLGKVVGTARKIQGFFASLRMTNKKVTASQDDNSFGFGKEGTRGMAGLQRGSRELFGPVGRNGDMGCRKKAFNLFNV
jgi:hypothetical protein